MTETDINEFISLFVDFVKRPMIISHQDRQILNAISNIKFIPIKKIEKIESKQITYEKEIGTLLSAVPLTHLPYCGTQCFILPESISKIHSTFFNQSSPSCNVVLQHLYVISQQCQQLSPEDNVQYEYLFYETYSYLQKVVFPAKQLDYRCIMFNGTLYKTENLVFEIPEEIPPYLFKVPSPLSRFKQFLFKVGVQQIPTYKHYASVLKCISSQCNPTHKLTDEKIAKSAKVAFSTMVSILRKLPPDVPIDLDRVDIYVLTDDSLIEPCSSVYYADNTSLLAKVRRYPRIKIHILATLTPDANGSGVPPVQLQIENLSSILIPSLSGNISSYQSYNQYLAKQYFNVLKSQMFHRALMRLYFHETKKNIIHLKAKEGKLYYSENTDEYPLTEGFLPVLDLVKSLQVICVRQIDIDLLDQRTNDKVCIPDIQCAYIDTKSLKLYIKSDPKSTYQLATTVAQELNSFLSKIFSKTISSLTNCFITQLNGIMLDFDEQDIHSCPFLEQIRLPPSVPTVAAPMITQGASQTAAKTPIRPSGPVTLSNLTSYRSHAVAQRTVCPRAGVDASRPDPSAAKLWIRTAQCDWRAANKLVRKSEEESSLFPPQACFLCFEATMKALIAFLHLSGGCSYDLYFERNLCILLEEAKKHITTTTTSNKLDELIIPLMNYDEQTRLPCLTSGMGFNTPRDCFTLEMSRGAVKSVRQILNKLKDATKEKDPNLESLMIEEGFIENSFLSLKEMFYCKLMIHNPETSILIIYYLVPMECDSGKIKLEIDTEEFFTIARSFFATLPNMKIIMIEKIMNKACWEYFRENVKRQVSKHGENCLMIKPLFHGTKATHPHQIYEHPVGFSTEFSRAGMWGKGLYFAVNASYSHNYAFNLGNGELCMFLAQVFVGYSEVRKADSSITAPKPQFHSVQGVTNGSQIHILYENGLAYPSYLITYSE